MTDYFRLLGQPRQPWLDLEVLQERFLDLSAQRHPDRTHGEGREENRQATAQCAEINAAYQCLRHPKTRLAHLLELETGRKPPDVQEMPHATTDLFLEVGRLCREVDQFLKARPASDSPILKAQYLQGSQEWMERLDTLRSKLTAWGDELNGAVQGLDVLWQRRASSGSSRRSESFPWAELEQIYRLLSYQERWTGQVQERTLRLMLDE